MTSNETWPPQSPRQALLSSPSGQQRYANYQSRLAPSPVKQDLSSPRLLDRLRHVGDKSNSTRQPLFLTDDGSDEEDEETLQLKLAAIQAKLKLKKLKDKERNVNTASVSTNLHAHARPLVEVGLSPTRRPPTRTEPRSPGRILLGIDKGIKGPDVSLKRARSAREPLSPTKRQRLTTHDRSLSTKTKLDRSRAENMSITSFSERMADVRDREQDRSRKLQQRIADRSKSFKLDHAQMTRFKLDAQHDRDGSPPTNKSLGTSDCEQPSTQLSHNIHDGKPIPNEDQGDANLYEGFSGIHLSSRTLPHTFLKRTLPSDQYKIYTIPGLLRDVTSPDFELPDAVGDYVIFGIIASKSSPLDRKTSADKNVRANDEWEKKWDSGSDNTKKFMAITLTDLRWTLDIYLFDTALPRYHRVSPGTVVAILNPAIMPPKRGREDTGAFSLSLHSSDDTVLEIGKAKHLGFCNAQKKDGKECGSWIDASKTEICEWHLNARVLKTQASRMGVNAGSNGFGNGARSATRGRFQGGPNDINGLLPTTNGRGFDRETGSQYYISTSTGAKTGHRTASTDLPPSFRENISTARKLDLDDPFLAEGQLARDKEARLQRRLATQQKERDIAQKLANLGAGTGAGAEYMRRTAEKDPQSGLSKKGRVVAVDASNLSSAVLNNRGTSHAGRIANKRVADEVSLSPIKKTRFLTSRGVKEAGHESLVHLQDRPRGKGNDGSIDHDDDDDDDDSDGLEII